ncbi:putative RNA methyltransferase [Neptunomonas antarctica]|uniref:23S rRNA (Guanine745-N1)-methyltransferase n=1 Tax=Neptunomonas antarctica TaxID=619304 RepID=A0A1N7PB53_9GAMM|nr:methyltransferase domain-containing protein [Neptunomonas antarctica]SIT07659.1 23S rRNA (guanine745-N1)-methyltransferase [Neptunomonas antarctica]
MNVNNGHLICPVCSLALTHAGRTLSCEQHHSYDQAKQGYWNLLLVQRKRSKDPGDNPVMVAARTHFLDQDYYQPLADNVCAGITQELHTKTDSRLLDMGCGEGYYTAQVEKALSGMNVEMIGLDISKHAIKAACRRSKSIHWMVASGAQMPVPEQSQDLLLVMFSRLMPAAFAKVLKPEGLLILAWPAKDHLLELRQSIYKEIKISEYNPTAELATLFSCEKVDTQRFEFTLQSSQDIQALLDMTPHSQRIAADTKETLLASAPLSLTFHVNLGFFRRL